MNFDVLMFYCGFRDFQAKFQLVASLSVQCDRFSKSSEVLSVELETPNEVFLAEGKESSREKKKNKPDKGFSSSTAISDIRGKDFLLEDLLLGRTGEMKNIVSTIQSNQDRMIRSDFLKPYGIQGGPGTGKTIVGLHRVSNILYQLRGKQNLSALVIGPSDRFIKYIENLLPSLGKNSVRHTTIENLCLSGLDEKDQAKVEVSLIDEPAIELVKSMLAMLLPTAVSVERRGSTAEK